MVGAGGAQLSAKLRPRRMDAVTRVGVWTAVGILFSVSGGMLWLLGYNYDGLSGSPLTKLHPFTYMIAAIFIWRSLAYGNPIGYGALVVSRRPASTLLIFVAICMIGLTAARGGPGIAGFVDTYIAPALLVFLLVEADERETAELTTLLHVVMTANALLGLFEFVSKTLVFPYRLDGELFVTDTRSTALQGHPLVNAMLTAIYIMGLLAGARSIPQHVKLGLVGLQCAALVVFGGRAAMVTTGLLGSLYGVWLLFRALRSNRTSLLGAACGMAILAIVPAAILAVISAGYLDDILVRFASDGGSANARVQMFDLFPHLSLRDSDRRSGPRLRREPTPYQRIGVGHREPDRPHGALSRRVRHPGRAREFLPIRSGTDSGTRRRNLVTDLGDAHPSQYLRKHRDKVDCSGQNSRLHRVHVQNEVSP